MKSSKAQIQAKFHKIPVIRFKDQKLTRAIYEDQMGLIWVGTSGRGLNKYDPDTERFKHFRFDVDNLRSLSNNTIFASMKTGQAYSGLAPMGVV